MIRVLVRAALPTLFLVGALASHAGACQVEPVREVVIGETVDEELTFAGFVTPLGDSTLVVAQPLDNQLKVFDWRGRFVRSVGREGAGPGEFRAIGNTARLPDGGFSVMDARLAKIEFFDRTGRYVETVSTRAVPLSRPLLMLSSDTLVVLRRAPGGAEIVPTPLEGGQAGERWFFYPLPPSRPPVVLEYAGSRTTMGNPIRDVPVVEGSVDGSGVVVVSRYVATGESPDSFRIIVLRTDGTRIERSITYRPKPMREADVERIVEAAVEPLLAMDRALGRQRPLPALRAAIRKEMWIPFWHPPVSDARLAPDGRVWVRREDGGTDVLWEIYAPDLRRVEKTFLLPSSSKVRAVDGDHIWVQELGELDQPLVVRYRIP